MHQILVFVYDLNTKMGEPDVFQLHLEGSGVYFGGQTVNGQVILETSYDLDNVKSVKVKIKGEGEVEWEETVSWLLVLS